MMRLQIRHRLKNLASLNNNEKGNVLFLILIAVALFAALSYAVTSSTRSGGGSASKETAEIQAAEIIQYATQIETAIMRMRLTNGCDETEINFYSTSWSGAGSPSSFNNTSAPSDDSCDVFHPNGGGVSWRLGPYNSHYYWFTAWRIVHGIGTTSNDLVMSLLVSEELCKAINERFDIGPNHYDSAAGQGPMQNSIAFVGSWAAGGNGMGSGTTADLYGQHTGCVNLQNSADAYPSAYNSTLPAWHFYHVLVAR